MLPSKDLRVALGGKASSEKDGSGGESEEVGSQGIHQLFLGKIKGACFFINTHRLKRTLRWPKMQCQDVKALIIPWNQLMMEIFGVR